MSRRFQFSLRALLATLLFVAVDAVVFTLILPDHKVLAFLIGFIGGPLMALAAERLATRGMPRPKFHRKELLTVVAGAFSAGGICCYIATTLNWRSGKQATSLSPKGMVVFFLLGCATGLAVTLAFAFTRAPDWGRFNRFRRLVLPALAISLACTSGAMALGAWFCTSLFLPYEFYEFVLQYH